MKAGCNQQGSLKENGKNNDSSTQNLKETTDIPGTHNDEERLEEYLQDIPNVKATGICSGPLTRPAWVIGWRNLGLEVIV